MLRYLAFIVVIVQTVTAAPEALRLVQSRIESVGGWCVIAVISRTCGLLET